MQIVGLTGSIAMGKSHAAQMFARFGVPVFDSDAAVHRLFAAGGPLPALIEARFPGCLLDNGDVDRRRLGARVLGDGDALMQLEALVHPAVRDAQVSFLGDAARGRAARVLLDVPLLFETRAEARMDAIIVVSCSPDLQRQRALGRSGMSAERLQAILAKQMSSAEKRRRADFLLSSGYDRGETARCVRAILDRLDHWRSSVWPDRWLNGSGHHARQRASH